jgi:hypothetical protein
MATEPSPPANLPQSFAESGPSLQAFLSNLQAEAGKEGRALPPVDAWNPTHCENDAGFEIRRDGAWWHEGVRMSRESLVRLFATILRKDADGETYLVTPAEKVRVIVEDAPFLGIRVDRQGRGRDQVIAVTTNLGDVTALGPDRPLRVSFTNGEPRPYALVRGRLEARLLRAPFYELVDWAEQHEGRLGVWSGGAFFPLEAA